MRLAVCRLSDGLVINMIVAGPDAEAPAGCELIEPGDLAGIGWTWDGNAFAAPPPEAEE